MTKFTHFFSKHSKFLLKKLSRLETLLKKFNKFTHKFEYFYPH
jgi:hypothetical protein